MKVKIRPATLEDVYKIYEIDKGIQLNPWSLEAFKEELMQPSSRGIVLTHGDVEIIGYFFLRIALDAVEIMTLGIHPSYQKQHLGEYLLREGLKGCPEGISVFLEVSHFNDRALSLYKKLGFKILSTRKDYYKDGSHGVCMGLNIRAIAKDQ